MPNAPHLASGILTGKNKLTRGNMTQRSNRNLLSSNRRGISFGSNTSNNHKPISAYTKPRRPLLTPTRYNHNKSYEYNLYQSRIGNPNRTPTRGTGRTLTPAQSRQYAQISASTNDLRQLERIFARLEDTALLEKFRSNYTEQNVLNNKSSRKTRKQSRRSRR
jgi:hypothetical protein